MPFMSNSPGPSITNAPAPPRDSALLYDWFLGLEITVISVCMRGGVSPTDLAKGSVIKVRFPEEILKLDSPSHVITIDEL